MVDRCRHSFLDQSFRYRSARRTARLKELDRGEALDAAIGVFREHGFERSSARMLVNTIGIDWQNGYAPFGDKWQFYREAVQRYGVIKERARLDVLHGSLRAINGLNATREV